MKAVIACAHKILRIIYKLLFTKQTYQKEKIFYPCLLVLVLLWFQCQ